MAKELAKGRAWDANPGAAFAFVQDGGAKSRAGHMTPLSASAATRINAPIDGRKQTSLADSLEKLALTVPSINLYYACPTVFSAPFRRSPNSQSA